MTNRQRFIQQRWTKHLLGGGITILCLFVFIDQINFEEVLEALANFHWVYLLWGIASLAFGYALRIMRWAMMLRTTGADARFANCSAPFLGSIALNNVLPLRFGDVVRALVFPKSMGISKTTATISLIVERLIDLMTLLASLAIGLFAIQTIEIPPGLKASAVTLAAIGGVILSAGFFFSRALGDLFNALAKRSEPQSARSVVKIYETCADLLHGFNVMSRPKVLFSMLIVSMFVWVGESGLFYFVLLGTGVKSTPLMAVLVMSVATLSTLVPSSPGYVGSFHLAVFTAISLVGGTAAQAASYAVIVHLALWMPTTIAGSLAIWLRPELFKIAKFQVA